MGNRFYYGMPATQAFQAMNSMDDDMQAKLSAAGVSASGAAGSASAAASSVTQANSARDAAIAAWQAGAAPAEQLAAFSQVLHGTAIVDVFLYDTGRDSDGGAWRKRCQNTSWYNEPVCPGKWLGVQNGTAAAIAAGGVAGDYFQYTLDGGSFWMIDSVQNSSAHRIHRGGTREFPALAAIVVELTRVIVYDLIRPGCPMWMVFTSVAPDWDQSNLIWYASAAAYAINGAMFVVDKTGSGGGVASISFIKDSAVKQIANASYGGLYKGNLADRNSQKGYNNNLLTPYPAIAHNVVNDVVAAVLPTAPVDPSTGLPTPTVVLATAGGVSILRDDGTVINSASTAPVDAVALTPRFNISLVYYGHWAQTAPVQQLGASFEVGSQGSGLYDPMIVYAVSYSGNFRYVGNPAGSMTKLAGDVAGGPGGILRAKRGDTAPKTMVAAITAAYNTGWQVGDARGAWGGDAALLPELVVNGSFDFDTAGWSAASGATLSVTNSRLVVTQGAAGQFGQAQQNVAVTPGVTYAFTYTVGGGTNMGAIVQISGVDYGVHAPGVYTRYFTAAANTAVIVLANHSTNPVGATIVVDSVSIKPVAQEIASGELISNGTFDTSVAGWTAYSAAPGGTIAQANGQITVYNNAGTYARAVQAIATEVGKTYVFKADVVSAGSTATLRATNVADGSGVNLGDLGTGIGPGTYVQTFVATAAVTYIGLLIESTANGATAVFDNVSVKKAVPDRSVKNRALVINGTVNKAPVAYGAQLLAYCGFSASNFLEQPYTSALDFGTGPFSFTFALRSSDSTAYILDRATYSGGFSGARIYVFVNSTGKLVFGATDGANYVELTTTSQITSLAWQCAITVGYDGSKFRIVQGGVDLAAPVARGAVGSLNNATAKLRIGIGWDGFPLANSALSLIRASGTFPSADQLLQMYRDELQLFQPGAQCTLDGANSSVTALTYDDSTDQVHVGTAWGRSAFKGLVRVESAATQVGSITTIAAAQGANVTGGATSARYAQPALTIREQLRRNDEARRAAAREELVFDFDGVAAQTAFQLPAGFVAKGVFVAGTKKRVGSTKDYTVSYDGYREFVNFGVSPGTAWVQVTANRSM